MLALSNSVHLYARPESRERLLAFFSEVLGLPAHVSSDAKDAPEPIYFFAFSNGAGLSLEFTADALSDEQALRGAWFELQSDDAAGLQQRALDFGLKRIVHPYTPFFYIQAPGGQVFRIVASRQ